MLGLLVVAPQFVRVFFGSQWERSIFLIQVLALVGLVQSISTLNGSIYLSQGRSDIQFHVGILFAAIVTIFFAIGLRWNVEGVAIAYAVATLLLTYPGLAIPFRLINLRVSHLFKQLSSILLAALGMGAIVFALRLFLKNALGVSDLVTLILAGMVGVVSYGGLLFILDRGLCREVFQLLRQLKPSIQEIAWQENRDSQSKKERI